MDIIHGKYFSLKSTASDINEHLPILQKYAKECEVVCEMGAKDAVTTWAFLFGILSNFSNQKTLYCAYSVEVPEASEIIKIGKDVGVGITFLYGDSVKLTLPSAVDLLFIDTWHVYGHLKRELQAHERNVRKYIIMHDTDVDGIYGESIRCQLDIAKQIESSGYPSEEISKGLRPAIDEFVEFHKGEWVLDNVWTNNNGLTVLRRKDVPHVEFNSESVQLTKYFCKNGHQL